MWKAVKAVLVVLFLVGLIGGSIAELLDRAGRGDDTPAEVRAAVDAAESATVGSCKLAGQAVDGEDVWRCELTDLGETFERCYLVRLESGELTAQSDYCDSVETHSGGTPAR